MELDCPATSRVCPERLNGRWNCISTFIQKCSRCLPMSNEHSHRTRTLALAAVLHAFTHIYQMALVPLYLPIQKFFRRDSVDDATLLVTALLVAYFLPSYPMGVLADRFSRKKLLSYGLLINALGFLCLAFAPNYPMAIACVIMAGVGGSFFHPAATAL